MDISKLLKARRIELSITQLSLARHIGFANRTSISHLERGKLQWKFKDVLKACELLKLNLTIVNK